MLEGRLFLQVCLLTARFPIYTVLKLRRIRGYWATRLVQQILIQSAARLQHVLRNTGRTLRGVHMLTVCNEFG